MGRTVVITVQYAGGLRRDLELPSDVPVAVLAPSVANAIHSIEGNDEQVVKCMFKRVETGEVLERQRSLDDYDVLHGEILELMQQVLPIRVVSNDEPRQFSGPGFIDASGLVLKIGAAQTLIGRADPDSGETDCLIDIDLTPADTIDSPSVSTRQAEITFESGQFLLRSLSNERHTIINLKPLNPNQPVVLHHGDHVCFGDIKLVFVWDGRPPPWSGA